MRYWRPDLRSVRRGEWIMFDRGRRIAILREVEIGMGAEQKERLIRSVTYAEQSADRTLIGYFPTLRLAAVVTWSMWQREMGQADAPRTDLPHVRPTRPSGTTKARSENGF
ncbi:hypothetical protein [Agromyces larvae]|uniref:Uncharacterized protein n=1 Tax=Agromyces larvae TaxID=2929802 RepID=A0ABY4C4U4_9MICO|nr:hypothetical protein [Agromyces larvae]UOE45989.1 hypothetical protein MTO99_09670 [Agromyces larvae]